MSAVGNQPELMKLAKTLGVEVDALGVVADLPAGDLRALRAQVAEALFQADRPAFARVAALSKSVPTAVAAKLTQATLPPLLAARTAELMEPQKAVDLVGRLSDSYLADVSAAMDAARAPEVVRAIPPEKVATISAELARRGEWVVIAGFVGEVDEPGLRASLAVYSGEQLLRIGYVLDDLGRLDGIVGMLSESQLEEIVAAAPDAGLWPELVVLLEHLSPAQRSRVAGRFAAADDGVREHYDAAVASGHLDADALGQLTS
ncbi:magnesium and cobalt transport protein CorA [Jatrophihabitans fulvus]